MADFLYKGVVDWFLQQMSQGELAPGDKMPSLRKLAKQLELSLNTVIHGYELLTEEGWIESRPKSGYFVCHKPRVKQAHVLAGDKVACFNEEIQKKIAWSALSHRAALVDQSDEFLNPNVRQGDSELPVLGKGHLAVRESVSEHLRKVAINVHPANIWLGRSPLAMYTQAIQTITQPNDKVLVITPCDPRLTSTVTSLGREIVTLAAGERGVDLDEAVRCLRDDEIKLVVLPSQFGFPTGGEVSNLSLRRWLAILQQVDIPAIEWDITSHLGYKSGPLMTYKSLDDKNQIVYIGGVESKGVDRNAAWCLAGRFSAIEGALLSADLALSDPQQQALMDALQTTQKHSLVRRARQIWSVAEKAKSTLELELGDAVRFAPSKGGLALWLQLDKPLSETQMTQLLAKHRHGLVPGYFLSAQQDAREWLAINVTYDAMAALATQLKALLSSSVVENKDKVVETKAAIQQEEVAHDAEMGVEEAVGGPELDEVSLDEVVQQDMALEEALLEPETSLESEELTEPLAEKDLSNSKESEKAAEKEEEESSKTVYNPMLDLINHDFG